MRFDSGMIPAGFLRDLHRVGKLPEGLEVEVHLKGRINTRGNFVCTLPEGAITSSAGYTSTARLSNISIPWRALFELPREQVVVREAEPGPGSIRMDSMSILWIRTGGYWKRVADDRYRGHSALTWAELVAQRGPMKSVPEEIGGAR